ncbi:MAG: low specificity L-threonine aldolase [Cryobacterium sp.]|nr:low specificity L-threonine aldolase [Oligoflexia bacterium]
MTVVSDSRISFGSDNHAGVHSAVLDAVARANVGFAGAYGADPWTARARELFRSHFGEAAEFFPVFNGSGANVGALSAAVKRFEGVICAAQSHIDADEGGAPERVGGMKLLTVPTADQKLTVDAIKTRLARRGDLHAVQPRVVSITQSTELGTVYSLAELREIGNFLRAEKLVFHMDGARIANAAATLGCTLRECTTDVGVDLLSFGGTKNGLLGAEAVVDLQGEFKDDLRFIQKQSLQLASKMRFISAQFIALLEGDLWLASARHANAMAKRLSEGAGKIRGLEIVHPVSANAVFVRMPRFRIETVQEKFPFYIWDEANPEMPIARWMTSFQTTEADVDAFLAELTQA